MRRLPSKAKGLVTTATVSAPSLARQAGHDGSAARPRAPAQPSGDKHHVRAFQGFDDLLRILQRRPPSDFRIAARTQSLGELRAQLNLQWGIGRLQRLGVGVGHKKVHAFQFGGDHAVDRIAPAAAHSNHLDLCAVAQFVREIHPEVPQLVFTPHDGSFHSIGSFAHLRHIGPLNAQFFNDPMSR